MTNPLKPDVYKPLVQQLQEAFDAGRASVLNGKPFGWYDKFNDCLYRDEASAKLAEDGGNRIIPLFTAEAIDISPQQHFRTR